ncbi:hypothetical protein cypCar_00046872, partial [Cyprinus carpio]
ALLIRALLEYSQCAEVKLLYGLALVGGIFLMELTRSWSLAFMWAVSYRTAARLRGATLTFAFQKILRLRSTKDISTGELVNICSSDGQRLYEAVSVGCLLAGGPLVGILGLSYTIYFFGPTALVGSAIFVIFYPTMMLASRLTAYFRKRCVTVTDRRVRLMNEILGCIKFIKMYCWETAFASNIQRVRSEERRVLEWAGCVQSLTVGVAPVVVVIASVCTFTLHMALGYDLTAAQAFTVVAVFNSMTFALKVTPLAVRALSEGSVAVKRFQVKNTSTYTNQKLLFCPYFLTVMFCNSQKDPYNAVEFKDATLAWEKTCSSQGEKSRAQQKRGGMKRVLRREKLSLYITTEDSKEESEEANAEHLLTHMEQESPQSTISSTQSIRPPLHKTLHRIDLCIRKMTLLGGSVAVNGDFAYVAQQAWILNDSLRENILFGKQYIEEKYNAVLEACCLFPDIIELPYGDMTECIFTDTLMSFPRGVFILQFLPECDEVVLMKDGQIAEHGTHVQLMEKGRDYAALFNSVQQENLVRKNVKNKQRAEEESSPRSLHVSPAAKPHTESKKGDQLMQAEEKGSGAVAWQVYTTYIKAAGGPLAFIVNILLFLFTTGSIAFSNWWLSHWIRQGSG